MNNGYHFTFDGKGCDYNILSSKAKLEGIIAEVIDLADMQAIDEVRIIKYDGGDDPKEWGLTGTCIIATSHVAIHTWPDKGYVAFDLFSCKQFDNELIRKYLIKQFQPAKNEWIVNTIPRGIGAIPNV